MKKTRILITALGGGGTGEQILKAILRVRDRYLIVGADANPLTPQLAHVDVAVSLPKAADPSYLDCLLSCCREHQIQALFCGCEPELKAVSKSREKIESEGIFLPINPGHVIDICMDKVKTNSELRRLGFLAPRFELITTKDKLAKIDWFPVIVKPAIGGGGSANVYVAQSPKELLGLADYLGLEANENHFFIQEYMGDPDAEYTVGVLRDMEGNYINSIAVRRLLSGPLNVRMSVPNKTGRKEFGPKLVVSSGISHGYIGRFPEVTNQAKEIAEAIGAKGPVNIQCRLVRGRIVVFEINPRFSGTTSLRAMVGYNEPDTLIRKHLLGENIQIDFPYEEALILRSIIENRIPG